MSHVNFTPTYKQSQSFFNFELRTPKPYAAVPTKMICELNATLAFKHLFEKWTEIPQIYRCALIKMSPLAILSSLIDEVCVENVNLMLLNT